jgi:hypothetical protein
VAFFIGISPLTELGMGLHGMLLIGIAAAVCLPRGWSRFVTSAADPNPAAGTLSGSVSHLV